MPTTYAQTVFLYFPGVYTAHNHGFEPVPVCPAPNPTQDVVVQTNKGETYTWFTDGWVECESESGLRKAWIPRPTLKDAIFYGQGGSAPSFFHFRSNGDISIHLGGEPMFFSGTPMEVAAVEGYIMRLWEEDYDRGSRWSDEETETDLCSCEGCCGAYD